MDEAAIELYIYRTEGGKEPFVEWLEELKDRRGKMILLGRLQRVRQGILGDIRRIVGGDGLEELRIPYGPGYRIYLVVESDTVVILFGGGDKGSQKRDIKKAISYIREYRESYERKLSKLY